MISSPCKLYHIIIGNKRKILLVKHVSVACLKMVFKMQNNSAFLQFVAPRPLFITIILKEENNMCYHYLVLSGGRAGAVIAA